MKKCDKITTAMIIADAIEMYEDWGHYDGSRDPEDFLIDLLTDIAGSLVDKYGNIHEIPYIVNDIVFNH